MQRTMQRFDEMAAGAREVEIMLEKGDIRIRVVDGAEWTLDMSSNGDSLPDVERDGPAIRVRQRHDGVRKERVHVEMVMPPGAKAVELSTGMGWIDAEGLRGRLRLKSGNGSITLRASGGNGEVATGHGAVAVDGYEGTIRVSSGNGSTVISRLDGQMDLHSGNGRIEVSDASGRTRASTGNGDIVLAGVGGDAEVQTGHGTVEVRSSRELSLHATSAQGAIRVTGGSVRALSLKTMMGTIVSDAILGPGRYELETAMGSATLALPADIAAHVEAQTGFGQVHSDFPLVRVGRSGPMGFGGVRMVGSIGGGEPQVAVAMRSGKGDLILHRAAGVAPSSTVLPQAHAATPDAPLTSPGAEPTPGEPTPGEPVHNRPPRPFRGDPLLVILEAVARGEISPAEADDLLQQRLS